MSGVFWFEIPVVDLTRAMQFYSTILDVTLTAEEGMGGDIAMLPGINGNLIQGKDRLPSKNGVLLFLDADPDLDVILSRVESVGGRVTVHKNSIGEYGFMAIFEDTEGNRLGLHSTG